MITLFGATGYTGHLVARALDRLGLPFRLAGRSAEKLARLADSLSPAPAWLVADATQPDTLPPLFQNSRLLVNCAGPFTDLGEPLVAQAALSGVHYMDITNELGYVYRMQSYDTLARRSGATILPACGFEVALADCAAALVCRAGELPPPIDEISVVYDLRGKGTSIGTRKSAVRALATSWLAYREGQWIHSAPCREVGQAQLPGGARLALSFPSSEIVTLPKHLPVRQVTTWMTMSRRTIFWASSLAPAGAWLARGPFGRLLLALVSRVAPPPPKSGMRSQSPFTIKVTARQGDKSWALTLDGRGVYDLTAEIAAYAAGRLAQPDHDRSGVLPPALALDPEALLDHAAAHWGVVWTKER